MMATQKTLHLWPVKTGGIKIHFGISTKLGRHILR